MKTKFKSMKITIVAVAFFAAMFIVTENSQAQRYANSDQFMRNYCVNISAKIRGLQGLINGIKSLLTSLRGLNGELASVNVSITPPTACLPNVGIDGGVKLPGLDDLAKCMGNFKVDVQVPDLSNVQSCISGLLSNVNFTANLNFNPQDMLKCLGGLDATIDLSGIAGIISGMAKALAQILSSLESMVATFDAKFDANFFAQIKALAKLCRQAGFRGA